MSILYFVYILSLFKSGYSESLSTPKEQNEEIIGETRRILNGQKIFDTRPYMVYLRPVRADDNKVDRHWVCGGVIIDKSYIVTSAACIEDVTYFYVVSGTHRWIPPTETNECIENGALRALWKCTPRTYRYDGNFFNNMRWMVNDIAVVKTEDPFNFYRRIKGCDFIPQMIGYNNISQDLEEPGRTGYIAGWGSTETYTDSFDKSDQSHNSPFLMETRSIIIEKSKCKHFWDKRYHSIIDKYMICGKQGSTAALRGQCVTQATCRGLAQREVVAPRSRRFENNPDRLLLHSAAHARKLEKMRKMKTRRLGVTEHGGFCENDHGGPLTIGHGKNMMLVGVISAYMTKNASKMCYGPYLYTSVFKNRYLIDCALYKEVQGNICPTVLRDVSAVLEEETFDWGPITPRSYLYEESDLDSLELKKKNNITTGTAENSGKHTNTTKN